MSARRAPAFGPIAVLVLLLLHGPGAAKAGIAPDAPASAGAARVEDHSGAPGAPSGDPYAIDHYTIDGGGGTSSGGTFEIQGTIGQPDADPLQPSTGGDFEITGGFWPGVAPATPQPDALFANGFE